MARGGSRTPQNPAPVSGPGALSRRTDGGAGSKTQPIRVPTGQPYGARAQNIAQQQAAPLPDRRPTGPGEGPSGPAGVAPPNPLAPAGPGTLRTAPQSVFGPTARPFEPPTAGLGASLSPGLRPGEVDDALAMLYSVLPHPQLLALIRR